MAFLGCSSEIATQVVPQSKAKTANETTWDTDNIVHAPLTSRRGYANQGGVTMPSPDMTTLDMRDEGFLNTTTRCKDLLDQAPPTAETKCSRSGSANTAAACSTVL